MHVSIIMIKCKRLQLQYSRGEFLTLPKFYSKQTRLLRSRSRKRTYTLPFSQTKYNHTQRINIERNTSFSFMIYSLKDFALIQNSILVSNCIFLLLSDNMEHSWLFL